MPKESPLKLTFGYAYIGNGTPGDSKGNLCGRTPILSETSFPVKLGKKLFINNRFRYELRNVENQNFRTRYRYSLFLNVPLNNQILEPKTVYLSMYNEVFINGQRKIGDGKTVPFFDRNRLYGALGYIFRKGLKMQFE